MDREKMEPRQAAVVGREVGVAAEGLGPKAQAAAADRRQKLS